MIQELLDKAQAAVIDLQALSEKKINELLLAIADASELETPSLLEANARDLSRMDDSDPKYDRLRLTRQRIINIASDIRHVVNLKSPIGTVIDKAQSLAGFQIQRRRVPFGVIGVIYEARPNVGFDVFSLCLKTQNVCLLKGGSYARESNIAIVNLIRKVLVEHQINPNVVNLLPTDREATTAMLEAVGKVDLIIPRGSSELIQYVRDNAKVPVIETGAGICHTYIDESADLDMAKRIITNAKTRRVSVCNALDCMIVHQKQLNNLPVICQELAKKKVTIYADVASYRVLKEFYPEEYLEKARDEHFGTEFLSLRMAIRTVASLEEAISYIRVHSSKHSECIVTDNKSAAKVFLNEVDAACVYHNVSTAFTDGAQFGLGAEIGISTQKLHARGPMGLQEICSYKWIIEGDGEIRSV